ncbi:MAG: type II toxin-antitoxin system CcdA family antitoxin [Candidatus Parvarchaeota archaeon]
MKTTVAFTIDTDVYDRLKRLDINKSDLVNEYLKYYVERNTGKLYREEEKIDPILEKKITMLRKELESTNFNVPPFYTKDRPDLVDIYLWDKSKEYGSRFEIKTDQALKVIEEYLKAVNEKKSTPTTGIPNYDALNLTTK